MHKLWGILLAALLLAPPAWAGTTRQVPAASGGESGLKECAEGQIRKIVSGIPACAADNTDSTPFNVQGVLYVSDPDRGAVCANDSTCTDSETPCCSIGWAIANSTGQTEVGLGAIDYYKINVGPGDYTEPWYCDNKWGTTCVKGDSAGACDFGTCNTGTNTCNSDSDVFCAVDADCVGACQSRIRFGMQCTGGDTPGATAWGTCSGDSTKPCQLDVHCTGFGNDCTSTAYTGFCPNGGTAEPRHGIHITDEAGWSFSEVTYGVDADDPFGIAIDVTNTQNYLLTGINWELDGEARCLMGTFGGTGGFSEIQGGFYRTTGVDPERPDMGNPICVRAEAGGGVSTFNVFDAVPWGGSDTAGIWWTSAAADAVGFCDADGNGDGDWDSGESFCEDDSGCTGACKTNTTGSGMGRCSGGTESGKWCNPLYSADVNVDCGGGGTCVMALAANIDFASGRNFVQTDGTGIVKTSHPGNAGSAFNDTYYGYSGFQIGDDLQGISFDTECSWCNPYSTDPTADDFCGFDPISCSADADCLDPCTGSGVPYACCSGVDAGTCTCDTNDTRSYGIRVFCQGTCTGDADIPCGFFENDRDAECTLAGVGAGCDLPATCNVGPSIYDVSIAPLEYAAQGFLVPEVGIAVSDGAAKFNRLAVDERISTLTVTTDGGELTPLETIVSQRWGLQSAIMSPGTEGNVFFLQDVASSNLHTICVQTDIDEGGTADTDEVVCFLGVLSSDTSTSESYARFDGTSIKIDGQLLFDGTSVLTFDPASNEGIIAVDATGQNASIFRLTKDDVRMAQLAFSDFLGARVVTLDMAIGQCSDDSAQECSDDSECVGTCDIATNAELLLRIGPGGNPATAMELNSAHVDVPNRPLTAQVRTVAYTSSDTLSAQDCRGSVITNTGASGAITLTLPSASDEQSCTFVVDAAQHLCIDPASGDQIVVVTDAAGDQVEMGNTQGTTITLVALDATNWMPFGEKSLMVDGNAGTCDGS